MKQNGITAKHLGCAAIVYLTIITACTSGGIGISTGTGSYMTGNWQSVQDPIGIVWKWDRTNYNNDTEITSADPGNYTLELLSDGRVSVRADCNNAGGTYKLNRNGISIDITHSTMAACPEGSHGRTYIRDLNSAVIFFFKGGMLHLDLKYDTGTMRFSK
jgi:heat shock protein HslJ